MSIHLICDNTLWCDWIARVVDAFLIQFIHHETSRASSVAMASTTNVWFVYRLHIHRLDCLLALYEFLHSRRPISHFFCKPTYVWFNMHPSQVAFNGEWAESWLLALERLLFELSILRGSLIFSSAWHFVDSHTQPKEHEECCLSRSNNHTWDCGTAECSTTMWGPYGFHIKYDMTENLLESVVVLLWNST